MDIGTHFFHIGANLRQPCFHVTAHPRQAGFQLGAHVRHCSRNPGLTCLEAGVHFFAVDICHGGFDRATLCLSGPHRTSPLQKYL